MRVLLILVTILLSLSTTVSAFETERINLSTGSDITDASFPFFKFTMTTTPEELENFKYIFNMNYITDETVQVTGVRLYLIVHQS